ncbi:DUF3152 domain-containing protein [Cellulomonas fimi]|nr:DUF3152 domain-containing protein [Cellulomonas fimi]
MPRTDAAGASVAPVGRGGAAGRGPGRGRRAVVGAVVAVGGLLVGAGTAVVTLPAGAATEAVRDVLGRSAQVARLAAVRSTTAPDASAADDRAADGDETASRGSLRAPVEEPVVAHETLLSADPPVLALPPGLTMVDVESGLLAADVPERARQTFTVVPGSDPGPGTGRVRTIRVEVEDGLPVDGARFAATVMATLNDPRGWGADGSVSFARTDGDAELRVLLASPETVDDLCYPLETEGQVSCGRSGNAVLNFRRWVLATDEYAADKAAYRQYLVNHEVGHLLGHGHETCPAPGALAPLMQQQSYRAAPCVPNPWPFPAP